MYSLPSIAIGAFVASTSWIRSWTYLSWWATLELDFPIMCKYGDSTKLCIFMLQEMNDLVILLFESFCKLSHYCWTSLFSNWPATRFFVCQVHSRVIQKPYGYKIVCMTSQVRMIMPAHELSCSLQLQDLLSQLLQCTGWSEACCNKYVFSMLIPQ